MRVRVRGIDLWFDVEGAGLVANGPVMRQKPTVLALHGGPGADHSIWKPHLSPLSGIAQVIYLDQRGNGRSDDGPVDRWTLEDWGDDVHAFCQALGIERPIVLGASFGGFVAQSYATRHPDHPGGLILMNTAARIDWEVIFAAFGRVAGAEAAQVAREYWLAPTPVGRQRYFETCLPHYARRATDPGMMARMIVKAPVAMHFNGPANQMGRFDFRAELARVTCPVLQIAAQHDVMTPPEFADEIGAALTRVTPQRLTLEDCGHLALNDQPAVVLDAITRFVADCGQAEGDNP